MYSAYGRVFAYDSAAPLNASIDAEQSTRLWTRQRIVFDAAYGGERMVLYLYLPSTGVPPYQTVIYWPGAAAAVLGSIDEYSRYMDFVVKSGRAVAFPIYKGTFERGDRTPIRAGHAGLSRQHDPGRERLAPVDRLPRVACGHRSRGDRLLRA